MVDVRAGFPDPESRFSVDFPEIAESAKVEFSNVEPLFDVPQQLLALIGDKRTGLLRSTMRASIACTKFRRSVKGRSSVSDDFGVLCQVTPYRLDRPSRRAGVFDVWIDAGGIDVVAQKGTGYSTDVHKNTVTIEFKR